MAKARKQKPVISDTDLAMIKLRHSGDISYDVLFNALKANPLLVKEAVRQAKPVDFNDDKAWDIVLASLDEYAREFYRKYEVLPEWVAGWFEENYPDTHPEYYEEITVFGGNGDDVAATRFDGVRCINLW